VKYQYIELLTTSIFLFVVFSNEITKCYGISQVIQEVWLKRLLCRLGATTYLKFLHWKALILFSHYMFRGREYALLLQRDLYKGPLPKERRICDQLRWVVGLLTGHCHLKGNLFKLGLTADPIRERCLEYDESSIHILCDCEAVVYTRFRHLGQCFMEPSDYYDAPTDKVLHFIRSVVLIKG
jgi:hypothetical protein